MSIYNSYFFKYNDLLGTILSENLKNQKLKSLSTNDLALRRGGGAALSPCAATTYDLIN